MPKMQRKSKTEFISLEKFHVSEFAQREAREYRVDELVSEFDIDRIGIPVVNFRDGRYYVMDGQHRIVALKRWLGADWKNCQIEVQVFSGLSEEEEAEMFLRLNNTLRVGLFDKFSKALTAGREEEVEVKRTVEAQGLTISKHKTPGSISAVGSLLKIYKRSNANTLGRSLRIIRDAYGDAGFEAAIIDGIGHLCQRYNGSLDEQTAKERLSTARGGVKGLLNRATEIHLRTGNAKPLCVGAAAVDIINSGKGGSKLPSWWKTTA